MKGNMVCTTMKIGGGFGIGLDNVMEMTAMKRMVRRCNGVMI